MKLDSGKNLAFLLGIPRSGTTLLSFMLNQHPQIHCPPEPWLLLALESLGEVYSEHPADAVPLRQATEAFLGHDRLARLSGVALELYADHLRTSGKAVFVDKTPRYYLIAPRLPELFPEARLIPLMRNPLDVAASYKSTWDLDLPMLLRTTNFPIACIDLVFGWARMCAVTRTHRDETVSYEGMVANPLAVLAQLQRSLGLAPVEKLEPFAFAGSPFEHAPVGDSKLLATDLPHQSSVGSWRTAFNVPDLQTLHDALGSESLRSNGYADIAAELSAMGVEDRGQEETDRWVARAAAAVQERRTLGTTAGDMVFGGPAARSELREAAARAEEQARLIRDRDDALGEREEAIKQLSLAVTSTEQRLAEVEGELGRLKNTRAVRVERAVNRLAASASHRLCVRTGGKFRG
jgi:Sulfotransferase family